jgi:hypothetical protein
MKLLRLCGREAVRVKPKGFARPLLVYVDLHYSKKFFSSYGSATYDTGRDFGRATLDNLRSELRLNGK